MTSNASSRTLHPTNESTDAANRTSDHASASDATARRRTGAAWIAGGALWGMAGLLYAGSGWFFRASSATFLAADVLLAAGIIGLLLLRPHGSSRPATAALIVAFGARVLFASAEVSGLITGSDDPVLLPIAGVLTGLSTIAYAALAQQADKRLRISTLAMGSYFFVGMMPFAVAAGEPPALALAAWGLPAAFVGIAINRSAPCR